MAERLLHEAHVEAYSLEQERMEDFRAKIMALDWLETKDTSFNPKDLGSLELRYWQKWEERTLTREDVMAYKRESGVPLKALVKDTRLIYAEILNNLLMARAMTNLPRKKSGQETPE